MSWRKVKLGELVENFSVRAKDVGGADGLYFYGVSNEEGIIKTKNAAEDKAEDYKIIEKGCFAYNPYRVNVGSIGLITDEVKGLISPAYVVFKPKPKTIIPELLFKFLKSDEGIRQIKFYARGTVRQALRFEDLCKIEISVPDYSAQEILFKKLTNSQNNSDLLNDEIKNQLSLVKKLRRQILQDAVQGKLVDNGKLTIDNAESGKDLLEKIKAEKAKLIAEKKLKKGKELPLIKPEEIPFEIPENWVWCRLGEILKGIKYGTSQSCDYDSSKNSAVLRIPNVSSGIINGEDLKFTNLNEEEKRELSLEENDILIIRSNGSRELVGRTVLVTTDFIGYAYAGYLVRLRFNKKCINPNYLWFASISPFFRESIETPLRTTVGINNINTEEMSNLLIPLPPLSEQTRIVEKLEELMAYCNELEASIKQSQTHNKKLLQQVLREALRGEAVEEAN